MGILGNKTTDIAKVEKDVEATLALELTAIRSQEDYTEAGAFLVKVKQTAKIVEAAFRAELDAALEKKRAAEADRKTVMDKIKFFTDKLDHAERQVKNVMSGFVMAEERRRVEAETARRKEEEERRLQTAIDTGNEEILEKPVAVKKETAPTAKGTYTVEVWEYQIADVSRINPDYLIPDEKAIGALVRSQKERAAKILGPGVNVIRRKDVRVRA